MYRLLPVRNQVKIKLVHIERRDRSREYRNVFQYLVKCLICSEFVLIVRTAPETLPVQTHVPVADMVAHEVLNHTAGRSHIVILVSGLHVLYQCIEQGDDPPVDFRTTFIRNRRSIDIELVHIRVKCEE